MEKGGSVLLLWSVNRLDRPDRSLLPKGHGVKGSETIFEVSERRIPYHGEYQMRGRWLADDYIGLRNAAWAIRNSRTGAAFNPLALRLVPGRLIRPNPGSMSAPSELIVRRDLRGH